MALKPPPKKGAGGATPGTPGSAAPANPLKPSNPLAKPASPAPAAAPARVAPAPAPARAVPAPTPVAVRSSSAPPTIAAPKAPSRPPAPSPALGKVKVLGGGGAKPAGAADKVKVGASGRVTLSVGKPKAAADPAAAARTGGEAPKDAKAEAEKIEERVFAIRGMKSVKDSPIFSAFCEKIAPRLDLPATSRILLEEFASIDVNAERVANCLKQNPYYEYHFLRHIESFGKRENTRLESAVILLGMQGSRNLVLALQLQRMISEEHPEWDKNGRLKLSPSDMLKYALRTEESLAGDKSAYADTAYAAGYVFDLLQELARQFAEDPKKVTHYIDGLYAHGLKTAQIGAELTEFFPEFPFEKYVYSACLLHDIGKALLAILSPVYLNYVEVTHKRELTRPVRLFAETKRFGINHALLGGLACYHFKMFRPIEKAILLHHEPYLLKDVNRNLYLLSSLVCLATNIASNFKRTDKKEDPIMALWKSSELRDFPLEPSQIIQAVKRVR